MGKVILKCIGCIIILLYACNTQQGNKFTRIEENMLGFWIPEITNIDTHILIEDRGYYNNLMTLEFSKNNEFYRYDGGSRIAIEDNDSISLFVEPGYIFSKGKWKKVYNTDSLFICRYKVHSSAYPEIPPMLNIEQIDTLCLSNSVLYYCNQKYKKTNKLTHQSMTRIQKLKAPPAARGL